MTGNGAGGDHQVDHQSGRGSKGRGGGQRQASCDKSYFNQKSGSRLPENTSPPRNPPAMNENYSSSPSVNPQVNQVPDPTIFTANHLLANQLLVNNSGVQSFHSAPTQTFQNYVAIPSNPMPLQAYTQIRNQHPVYYPTEFTSQSATFRDQTNQGEIRDIVDPQVVNINMVLGFFQQYRVHFRAVVDSANNEHALNTPESANNAANIISNNCLQWLLPFCQCLCAMTPQFLLEYYKTPNPNADHSDLTIIFRSLYLIHGYLINPEHNMQVKKTMEYLQQFLQMISAPSYVTNTTNTGFAPANLQQQQVQLQQQQQQPQLLNTQLYTHTHTLAHNN
eukprot:GHVR01030385.1.p1 GENE.GHVR01030385.1~~GHVR01030385.1.p1  ORF type:complete len:355 (+),score=21.37 GHVR01030385.1:63-1067(+)